jgi:hypothetical protein
MSIIAKALQKAQKERAERLRRAEELKRVRAEAAARFAPPEKAQELQEVVPPTNETEPQIAAPLAAKPAKAAPDKKALFPHILAGSIVLLCIVLIGSVLLIRPLLTASEKQVKQARPAPAVYKPMPAPKETVPAAILEPETVKQPSAPVPKTQTTYDGTIAPADLPIVSGIMYSPTNPQAIINGALVTVGDVVTGYTILKINPSTVLVSSHDTDYEIRMR